MVSRHEGPGLSVPQWQTAIVCLLWRWLRYDGGMIIRSARDSCQLGHHRGGIALFIAVLLLAIIARIPAWLFAYQKAYLSARPSHRKSISWFASKLGALEEQPASHATVHFVVPTLLLHATVDVDLPNRMVLPDSIRLVVPGGRQYGCLWPTMVVVLLSLPDLVALDLSSGTPSRRFVCMGQCSTQRLFRVATRTMLSRDFGVRICRSPTECLGLSQPGCGVQCC